MAVDVTVVIQRGIINVCAVMVAVICVLLTVVERIRLSIMVAVVDIVIE
jgi:hypothetical protein